MLSKTLMKKIRLKRSIFDFVQRENPKLWKMEILFVILISVCISLFLRPIIVFLLVPSKRSVNLPPGPGTFPVIGNLLWLRKSSLELEAILADFCHKHGPFATIKFGSRSFIFIADPSVAHSALIQNGAMFADRPSALAVDRILSSEQHNINSSFYGPTWRLFRRNLTSEILHPSRIRSYSHARKWVLEILINRLQSSSESGEAVRVVGHFQYAMFCLLVLMCFGDKLDESKIKEIEQAHRDLLLSFRLFSILNFLPNLSKIFFRKRWALLHQLKANQENVLIPLIKERIKAKEESIKNNSQEEEYVVAYVDSLLDLYLPEEKRKLKYSELVSLCSEFLNAGTDTTSTALQWIMANVVKYPDVQNKVFEEIKATVREGQREVEEEDLGKLHYLKAVVLESLRRHPPAHFVLPHAVREDVELEGYTIPKNCAVNFMVANMGRDPKVWEDPMAFKPERFINEEDDGPKVNFDITGSKEIKMMPFGAGRRICPGYGLAILHLQYFVANLVWKFEWKGVEGEDVDLSEKQEFTIVMKNPLQAHLRPRT